MSLSVAQQKTLRDAIKADATLPKNPAVLDLFSRIADALNVIATPAFPVWRTSVTESEITQGTGPSGTTWNWPLFVAALATEQGGWSRLFSNGACNPSLPNTREAWKAIFNGNSPTVQAQIAHLTAVSQRSATKAEKILAIPGTPATLTFEGALSADDVQAALAS